MRWSLAIVAMLLMLVVAACGGAPSSTADGNGGGGGGGASSAPASQDDGGNGGGGGTPGSAESVFNDLIPPNSTEVSRTNVGGAFSGNFTSTDSADSLRSHYESAIPGTGMTIFGTTNAQGGTAWVFAESESSSFGGSVSVYPNTDAEGSVILIAVSGD